VETVRRQGPLGSETNLETLEIKKRLSAAKGALEDDRLRWLVGREKELIEQGNVFGEKLSQDEFDRVMIESIEKEYTKSLILQCLANDALTINEIATRTNTKPRDVLKNLISLEQERQVSVTRIEDNIPLYIKSRL
jgi:hypothetical protein